MKLFKIMEGGESYHVAAETKKDAYAVLIGMGELESIEDDCIVDVPETEWPKLIVHYDENDDEGNQIKIPADELMKGCKTPELICSSVYS